MPTASAQIDALLTPMTSPSRLAVVAELYELHYEAVFRAALRVTGNPADAEDVMQTVFLRLLDREQRRQAGPPKRADDPGNGDPDAEDITVPGAYFRRAAVNAAVDVLRRRQLHGEAVYDDQAPHAAVQPPFLLKERLRRGIAALDTEDASLFLLRHVEGLSIEELARLFKMEKNNVGVRLHRIRHRLQAEMER